MNIIKNELGNASVSYKSLTEIAQIACLDEKNIEVNKSQDYATVTVTKENELIVTISLRIAKNADIVKTCKSLQDSVSDAYQLMTGITPKEVNINVNGFIK